MGKLDWHDVWDAFPSFAGGDLVQVHSYGTVDRGRIILAHRDSRKGAIGFEIAWWARCDAVTGKWHYRGTDKLVVPQHGMPRAGSNGSISWSTPDYGQVIVLRGHDANLLSADKVVDLPAPWQRLLKGIQDKQIPFMAELVRQVCLRRPTATRYYAAAQELEGDAVANIEQFLSLFTREEELEAFLLAYVQAFSDEYGMGIDIAMPIY